MARSKESAWNARDTGDWVPSLDQEDLPEEGMTTHCSVLTWRIPCPTDRGV